AEATFAKAAATAAKTGRRFLLLVGDGRGDKHLLAPNDRARPAVAGERGFPLDVPVVTPFGRDLTFFRYATAVGPAKLGPVVRPGECGGEQGTGSYGPNRKTRHWPTS